MRSAFPGFLLSWRKRGRYGAGPRHAAISAPEHLPLNSSGLAELDGRYYAWRYAAKNSGTYLVVAPLSRRYLSGMMPGIGDVYFLQRDSVSSSDASGEVKPKTSTPSMSSKAVPGYPQNFHFTPAGGDAPRAALAPPVNRFDLPVQWGSFTRAVDWAHADHTEPALLVVRARLSSILTAILSAGRRHVRGALLITFYILGGGVPDCRHCRTGDRDLDVAQHHRRSPLPICGNAAGDARRFFALDPGVRARPAR